MAQFSSPGDGMHASSVLSSAGVTVRPGWLCHRGRLRNNGCAVCCSASGFVNSQSVSHSDDSYRLEVVSRIYTTGGFVHMISCYRRSHICRLLLYIYRGHHPCGACTTGRCGRFIELYQRSQGGVMWCLPLRRFYY